MSATALWRVWLTGTAVAVCLLAVVQDAGATSVPKWVKIAISRKLPAYSRDVPYAVLLDEATTTVKKSGKAETKYRYVIELLTSEGRPAARKDIYYDEETSVSNIEAWHIRAGGGVEKLERDGIQEESLSDDLYSDSRTRIVRFGDADVGSIIAFQWTQEQRPFINQQYHFFQERAPVLLSIYRLKLPAEWRVEPLVFNHPPVEPVIQGNTYLWQLSYLPPIKREPMMPAITSVAPYLAVSYFPARGKVTRKSFGSWQEVSEWASQLMDHQAQPDEAIEQRARNITSGLGSVQAKVNALSIWVQKQIRYVSIQLGSKGGYRPHPAALVLKKGYGDCKDKACLLESMLASIGVKSYITLVYSGDPTRVKADFPSVLQFNHAILAIDVSGEVSAGNGAGSPRDLMFFDPSDAAASPGELPYYLQGSYGLVVRGSSGVLIKLPEDGEEANHLIREASLVLDPNGVAAGTIREKLKGQVAAVSQDSVPGGRSETSTKDAISEIAGNIPGAEVKLVSTSAGPVGSGEVDKTYSIRAPGFAGLSGKIMVAKPLVLWRWRFPAFESRSRTQPIVFKMKSVQEDTVSINLRPGLRIDEYPRDSKVETAFGEFSLTYQISDHQIIVHRRLVISSTTIPASEYGSLSAFFEEAQRASDAGIVFLKD